MQRVSLLNYSVSVVLLLEWASLWNVDVIGLIFGESGELSIESWEMEGSDLLVEFLWKNVDLSLLVFVGVFVLPEVDLGEDLVGKGA